MTVLERWEGEVGKADNCQGRCAATEAELPFGARVGLEGQEFCAVTRRLLVQEAGWLFVVQGSKSEELRTEGRTGSGTEMRGYRNIPWRSWRRGRQRNSRTYTDPCIGECLVTSV